MGRVRRVWTASASASGLGGGGGGGHDSLEVTWEVGRRTCNSIFIV